MDPRVPTTVWSFLLLKFQTDLWQLVTQLLTVSEYANGVKDTSLIPKVTLLIIGGTETASTVILGLIYHLTAYPRTYQP